MSVTAHYYWAPDLEGVGPPNKLWARHSTTNSRFGFPLQLPFGLKKVEFSSMPIIEAVSKNDTPDLSGPFEDISSTAQSKW